MSWLRGYKKDQAETLEAREAKRRQLEEDRLLRAQKRADTQKQLQRAQEARKEADQALQSLLEIDPDIFDGPAGEVDESILDDSNNEEIAAAMVDFDKENADDTATAMENLRSVHCPFNKEDIEFWFCQFEDQLTLIGVKKQWTKKIALVRFLPPEVQIQCKSLLKLQQTAAGADIYLKIKKQLLKLYGPKPEDAYMRAKNRIMTGKPSELGNLLIEDLCPGDVKLDGCHCDRTVWGMFREALPIVIRNHIADMPFNKDTYEAIFDKADQVFDSNRGPEPLRQVAAVSASNSQAQSQPKNEVAAVQKPKNQSQGQKNKNKNQQSGQSGKNKNQGQDGQGEKVSKPPVNEDKLCKIHAKWKENATFCAAPWACRMKNVWKAPQ